MSEEIKIIETNGTEVFEAQERASIDVQITTAKKFPRNLIAVRSNSVAIATMSKETAESCRYSKPVAGKKITGPSVHLARIIAQQYGNIRVQAQIKSVDSKTIVATATAYDLETNYAVCVEARRSIIDKNGNRYSESTIETNAMAIMAIAKRNAILEVVPKALTESVYEAAFKMINGDLSNESAIVAAREKSFKHFKDTYDIDQNILIAYLGVFSESMIKSEEIAELRSLAQALKDKETTKEDVVKYVHEKIKKEAPNRDVNE